MMLKDAIFEISSPLRHMCEMAPTMEAEDRELPVQLIYTDGGEDHRTTLISVQMAYLANWLTNDLDCLIACRCPPLISITNPCEIFMQTANIGLNGLALARYKMSDANDKEISKLSSNKKWRAAQKPNDDGKVGSLKIRELLKQTTQFCFESLTDRFNSLKYKGEAVRVKDSVSTDDIASLMMVLDCIDPDIDWTDTTLKKVKVMERPLVRSFFAKHVRVTQYCFQVKKCRDDECVFHDTIRMDEEEFSSVHWLPMPLPQAGDADS